MIPSTLSISSKVHSKYTPMFTSKLVSNILPIAVDYTLPAYLALCSQVHSQEEWDFYSHLTIASLYASA